LVRTIATGASAGILLSPVTRSIVPRIVSPIHITTLPLDPSLPSFHSVLRILLFPEDNKRYILIRENIDTLYFPVLLEVRPQRSRFYRPGATDPNSSTLCRAPPTTPGRCADLSSSCFLHAPNRGQTPETKCPKDFQTQAGPCIRKETQLPEKVKSKGSRCAVERCKGSGGS